ncbi:type II secretion system protein N [Thermaurantiacus sp.]
MMLRTGWPLSAILLLALLLALALLLGIRAIEALQAPALPESQMAPSAAPDHAILGRFDPFFRNSPADGTELAVTALPLTLKGLRLDSASGRGAAFIAGAEGFQRPYQVGDEVMEGVTLAGVATDHVILSRGGVRETLWLDEAGRAAAGASAVPDGAAGAAAAAAGLAASSDAATADPNEPPSAPDEEEGP